MKGCWVDACRKERLSSCCGVCREGEGAHAYDARAPRHALRMHGTRARAMHTCNDCNTQAGTVNTFWSHMDARVQRALMARV